MKHIPSNINYLHVHSIRQGEPVFIMNDEPSKIVCLTREQFRALKKDLYDTSFEEVEEQLFGKE